MCIYNNWIILATFEIQIIIAFLAFKTVMADEILSQGFQFGDNYRRRISVFHSKFAGATLIRTSLTAELTF